MRASARRRKAFIQSVSHQGTVLTEDGDKLNVFLSHLNSLLGTLSVMQRTLNLQASELSPIDTASLDAPFEEDEVKTPSCSSNLTRRPGQMVLCKKEKKKSALLDDYQR